MTAGPLKFNVYMPQDAPYAVVQWLATAADQLSYDSR
jgi:hypothetical protein